MALRIRKGVGITMNVGLILIMIIGGAAGLLSTLYLLFSLPVVIIWKIYRRIRYGYSLNQ